MRIELLCPACGACNFDFNDYESVVLLAPNLALMQFSCSRCKIHLSATVKLTTEMQYMIQQKMDKSSDDTQISENDTATANAQPDNREQHCSRELLQPPEQHLAAITDKTTLSYASAIIVDGYNMEYGIVRPLRTAAADLKDELEYFKNQLDTIDTVDQAIKEIDTNSYPKRRDI